MVFKKQKMALLLLNREHMQKMTVPTTKKLLGTLALIALISVILAKFFSDLAFADDQRQAQPAQITQTEYHGDRVIEEIPTVCPNTLLALK
jgi:hypothetical protein